MAPTYAVPGLFLQTGAIGKPEKQATTFCISSKHGKLFSTNKNINKKLLQKDQRIHSHRLKHDFHR